VPSKKIILNISPQTWCRVTQRDKIFFRIPFEKLYPSGQKRKLRIQRYNDYKLNLSAEAKRNNFELPDIGAGIIFYIPVPKSWSKKKKRLHHGLFHGNLPDLKNCLQAFEDSLRKQDKSIAFYSHLGKRWVNAETGWIEVTINDPAQIFMLPPSIEGESSPS